jgi:hypothetical protein
MNHTETKQILARRRFLQIGIGTTVTGLGLAVFKTWPKAGHEGHDHSDFGQCDPSDGHDHSLCETEGKNSFVRRPRTINTQGQKKLVILELEGANDIFDTLIPIKGNPQRRMLEKYRPELLRNTDVLLNLTSIPGVALPPQLPTLHRLLEENKAAVHQFERDGGYRSDWLLKKNTDLKPISLWQTLPEFLQTTNHPTGGIPFNPAQQHPLASNGSMPGPKDSVEASVIRQAHEMFVTAKQHQDQYLGKKEEYRAEPGEALSVILEALADNVQSNVFYTCQPGYGARVNYLLNRNITLTNLDNAIRGFVEDPDNLENITLAIISPTSRSLALDNDGVPEPNNRFGHMILIGANSRTVIPNVNSEKEILLALAQSSLATA